jgi:chemotaxis signal transduction protein
MSEAPATTSPRDPDAPPTAGAAVTERTSLFVLRLGGSLYAVPGELVEQVAPPVRPVRVPGSAAQVLGVVQLHERILAVVDAHAILGVSRPSAPGPDDRPRLVALRVDRSPFALVADAVLGMHEVLSEALKAADGAPAGGSLTTGTVEIPGGVVTVLAPDALLRAVSRR